MPRSYNKKFSLLFIVTEKTSLLEKNEITDDTNNVDEQTSVVKTIKQQAKITSLQVIDHVNQLFEDYPTKDQMKDLRDYLKNSNNDVKVMKNDLETQKREMTGLRDDIAEIKRLLMAQHD